MGEHRRKERLLSNAQVWYVLIAGTILVLAAIMEFGGGGQ